MSGAQTVVLIPARMAATRLPGKPLADVGGRPMIVEVARRAAAAEIGRVVVATDSPQVAEAVIAAGFEAASLSRLLGAGWLRFALICLALAIVRELSDASLAAGAVLAVLCAGGALLAARTHWRQVTTLMQAKEATP